MIYLIQTRHAALCEGDTRLSGPAGNTGVMAAVPRGTEDNQISRRSL